VISKTKNQLEGWFSDSGQSGKTARKSD